MIPPMARVTRLKRLAELVKHRREELDLTVRDAARLAGLSPSTWIKAEQGEVQPQGRTLAKIDKVLGWPSGTSRARLTGERLVADAPQPESIADEDVARWAETNRRLDPYERAFVLAVIARIRRG
jgi:transcriptional regulator with XRE-family HTH domain